MKKYLYSSDAKYRNSDPVLVAAFQWSEVKALGKNPYDVSMEDFLNLIIDGKITASDRITRARRKCNQLHEDTRGDSYKPRQKKQEEVKDELRDIKK